MLCLVREHVDRALMETGSQPKGSGGTVRTTGKCHCLVSLLCFLFLSNADRNKHMQRESCGFQLYLGTP